MSTTSTKYHLPTHPSMLRRANNHDYYAPSIYLVTVMKNDGCPRLCEVKGTPELPIVDLSYEGRIVVRELRGLQIRYPQVQVIAYQVMPDHVHVVLHVRERLPEKRPLSSVIASWKAESSKAYWDSLNLKDQARSTNENHEQISLFAKGFNDTILQGDGQLNRMVAYVRNNPRRLLLRRLNSELFEVKRAVQIAGRPFDTVGNLELLKLKKRVVHCHRHWSELEGRQYQAACMEAVNEGMVLVSPFISKLERTIMHQALEKRASIIRLVENGFPDRYKPEGQYFDVCAEGRLLLLSPWKYHTRYQRITRQQCESLNQMAEQIAVL